MKRKFLFWTFGLAVLLVIAANLLQPSTPDNLGERNPLPITKSLPHVDHVNPEHADARWISRMIQQNQATVEIARNALARIQNEKLRVVIQQIMEIHQDEMTQLDQWQRQWHPSTIASLDTEIEAEKLRFGQTLVHAHSSHDFEFAQAFISRLQTSIQTAESAQAQTQHHELKKWLNKAIQERKKQIAQLKEAVNTVYQKGASP